MQILNPFTFPVSGLHLLNSESSLVCALLFPSCVVPGIFLCLVTWDNRKLSCLFHFSQKILSFLHNIYNTATPCSWSVRDNEDRCRQSHGSRLGRGGARGSHACTAAPALSHWDRHVGGLYRCPACTRLPTRLPRALPGTRSHCPTPQQVGVKSVDKELTQPLDPKDAPVLLPRCSLGNTCYQWGPRDYLPPGQTRPAFTCCCIPDPGPVQSTRSKHLSEG